MTTQTARDARTHAEWLSCAAVMLGALALYLGTVCPTVYFYDSAEFASAAAVLGIPHPPGYPIYTLLGNLYIRVSPGDAAHAVNVMSSVHGAACVTLVFLLQRRLHAGRLPALCGAAFFATGRSFWLNSSVAEVFTTGLMAGLAVWLLLLEGVVARREKLVLMGAFVGGLGFATHMFVATLGLGYIALVWCAQHESGTGTEDLRRRTQRLAWAALCAFAGASTYLYLPLRAAMSPKFSTIARRDLMSFLYVLTGGPYATWFLQDYDRTARLIDVTRMLAAHLSTVGLVLGGLGLALLTLQQRAIGLALCLGVAGNLWFFFAYAVHDVEVFFLPERSRGQPRHRPAADGAAGVAHTIYAAPRRPRRVGAVPSVRDRARSAGTARGRSLE